MGITICHRRKFGQVWGSPASLSEVMWKLCCRKTPLWTFNYHISKNRNHSAWGACLILSKFGVLGANDPEWKVLVNFCRNLHFNRDSRVVAKFGENRPLRSCWKVLILLTKNLRRRGHFSGPPFWPHLTDRAQNFVFKFLSYLMLNNIVTLKCGLELTRGHSNMWPPITKAVLSR